MDCAAQTQCNAVFNAFPSGSRCCFDREDFRQVVAALPTAGLGLGCSHRYLWPSRLNDVDPPAGLINLDGFGTGVLLVLNLPPIRLGNANDLRALSLPLPGDPFVPRHRRVQPKHAAFKRDDAFWGQDR